MMRASSLLKITQKPPYEQLVDCRRMDERGTVPVQVDGVRDWTSSVAEELLRVLRSDSSSDVAGPSYVSPHFGRSMVDPGTPDDPLPGFVEAEQASSGKPAWNQQAF